MEETARLLPGPVRQELQRTVGKILQQGSSRGVLFVIGRPSEEWWQKVRQGAIRLAELFKPVLETSPTK